MKKISFAFIALLFIPLSQALASMSSPAVLELVNAERAKAGLSALITESKLTQVAQLKANDMAAKGYFDHVTPDGHDPWYFYALVGYNWSWAGENLGMIQNSESESAIVEAWMNSPEHRKIILDGRYTETGIGIAEGMYQGAHTIFVAEEFGVPKVAAVPSKVSTVASPVVSTKVVSAPKPVTKSTQSVTVAAATTTIASAIESQAIVAEPAMPIEPKETWIKRLISYIFSRFDTLKGFL